MRVAELATAFGLVGCLAIDTSVTQESVAGNHVRRMSFHNRLLLNRAAVSGLRTLEVMLVVTDQRLSAVSLLVESLGGRIRRRDASVGYLRVEVPTDKLLALV